MLRILSSPGGHLLNIAMKGLGMNAMVKLVAFAAGHQLREVEMHEAYTDEEWRSELRRAIVYCGNDDKPLTFFIDEYKLLKDHWYDDLECVIKSNTSTEIAKKSELNAVLLQIYKEVEREKKAMTIGLSTSDFKKDSSSENVHPPSKDDKNADVKKIVSDDSRKMLKRWPHIQADLYKIFLNRIR